jgi:tRNA-splicing ligase RtcB
MEGGSGSPGQACLPAGRLEDDNFILYTQTLFKRGGGFMGIEKLRRIDPTRIEVPPDYKPGMRVKGIIYADEVLGKSLESQCVEQVANVATLPGIVKASMAMPDIHMGYGFAIGGVAAFDLKEGIISPGGVGYDIN